MLTDKRKEELRELMYTWRDLTAAGASVELNCEELHFMLEVENNRPPPRVAVQQRLQRMIDARCRDADQSSENNAT